MEGRSLASRYTDDSKNSQSEFKPEQMRGSLFIGNNKFGAKTSKMSDEIFLKNTDEEKNVNEERSSVNSFRGSMRSSVSTNVSLRESVGTFKDDNRSSTEFSLSQANSKNVKTYSNLARGSMTSSLSYSSINSGFSTQSGSNSIGYFNPRAAVGIFNKQNIKLIETNVELNNNGEKVANEENKHKLENYENIEKEKIKIFTTKLITNEKLNCITSQFFENLTVEKKITPPTFFKKIDIITPTQEKKITPPTPEILKTDKYTYHGFLNLLRKREGYGICYYKNGDKYSGFWSQDKKEGWGIYEFKSSGKIFQGEFINNQIDGYVEYINKNGVTHQGYMKNQKFLNNEVMTIYHPKYELIGIMEFNTTLNKLTGVGAIKYKNGTFYEGETLESHEHGWGITKNPDNTVIRGLKEDNNFNSYCEIIYPNNDKYFGWFLKNKRHGLGIMIQKDGTYTLGKHSDDFKDGGFISLCKGEAKFELHLFGFLTKSIEKKENIISYLNLVYPEHKWLIKTNNKMLYEILASS
jgi:hypothetical protein